KSVSDTLLNHYGISSELVPEILPVFGNYGSVTADVAEELSSSTDAFVSYKAGDQPNNALSLNVFEAGEVAATAGTSGVIYAVTDQLVYDKESRVNTFAHVTHENEKPNLGVLLCINGTGIQNSWIKKNTAPSFDYMQIDRKSTRLNSS